MEDLYMPTVAEQASRLSTLFGICRLRNKTHQRCLFPFRQPYYHVQQHKMIVFDGL
jgi:hypothetical protein